MKPKILYTRGIKKFSVAHRKEFIDSITYGLMTCRGTEDLAFTKNKTTVTIMVLTNIAYSRSRTSHVYIPIIWDENKKAKYVKVKGFKTL